MAGKPAARVGDPTAHGGFVVGPGVATVLIGGKPAARLGDEAICEGPPAAIVDGCATVLIGDGGGGGGGGGSGGAGAGEATTETVAADVAARETEDHRLDVTFTDKSGKPITGVTYNLELADGSQRTGNLPGHLLQSGVPEGNCTIRLRALTDAHWSAAEARVGEPVRLQVKAEGFDDGTNATFHIYQQHINAPARLVATLPTTIHNSNAEAEWRYAYPSVEELESEGRSGQQPRQVDTRPEYFFFCRVGNAVIKSGLLRFRDWVEIQLRDSNGSGVGNARFRAVFSDGHVVEGTLDASGMQRIESVGPGCCTVEFPDWGLVMKGPE